MKLVKIIKDKTVPLKNRKKQEYHYECIECCKTIIHKQKKPQKTDYCHACMLKNIKPRTGTGVYKDRRWKENVTCPRCKNKYMQSNDTKKDTLCTSCAIIDRPKKSNCTSKYIGVSRVQKKTDRHPAWLGKAAHKGKVVFKCTYKASDLGSDTVKQDLCAIHRDIHIQKHNLPNKKNFTDKQLKDLIYIYTKQNLM